MADLTAELEHGGLHRFADFPTLADLPRQGAAIYTIWDDAGAFIYVGVAGRNPSGKRGPWGRLRSHWNGRRSGDQFCVYVADHYVLPELTREQVEAIAAQESTLFMDDLVATRARAVQLPAGGGPRLRGRARDRGRDQGWGSIGRAAAAEPTAAPATLAVEPEEACLLAPLDPLRAREPTLRGAPTPLGGWLLDQSGGHFRLGGGAARLRHRLEVPAERAQPLDPVRRGHAAQVGVRRGDVRVAELIADVRDRRTGGHEVERVGVA